MNPLLENFLKRPGITISIIDEWFDNIEYTSTDYQYDTWLESLVENVDYQIYGQKILLNPKSPKIQRIKGIVVNETLKNLDTSILSVNIITVNASVLENLIIGDVKTVFTFNTGSPSNVVFTGNNYNNVYINGGTVSSIEAKNEDAFKNVSSLIFNPNTISTESNKKKEFLRKTLKARNLTIKQSIIDDLDDDDLKTQINTKIYGSRSSYGSSYGNDLVGNPPEIDYKYFTNTVDTDYGNLANWFEDADHLIPSLSLPNAFDSVYIASNVTATGTGDFQLANATVYGSVSSSGTIRFFGRSITKTGSSITANSTGNEQYGAITFEDLSENNANFNVPPNSFIVFKNNSKNYYSGSGNSTFVFRGLSQNLGSIYNSIAKFYEYAVNASANGNGRIYNNAYFYDASRNEGTIYYDGYFYDYAQNRGNIFVKGEFSGLGTSANEHSSLNLTIPLYNNFFARGAQWFGCIHNGTVSNLVLRLSSMSMDGSTGNSGAYCYDNSKIHFSSINGDLYFYDNSGFKYNTSGYLGNGSTVSGYVFQSVTSLESLSSYVSNSNNKYVVFSNNLSSVELDNITIYGGISSQQITLTNCNVPAGTLLIGNVTFNTIGINNNASIFMQSDITRGNKGEIRGNATFNGYSYHWRQSVEYSNNQITSYPMIGDGYPGSIKDWRAGWISGNATFNDNSVNGGAITGNATFNDQSKNIFPFSYYNNQTLIKNGLVKGDATFNDFTGLQDNKGLVEGLSAVNYPLFYTLPLSGPSSMNGMAARPFGGSGARIYYNHRGCSTCSQIELKVNLAKLEWSDIFGGTGIWLNEPPTDGVFPLSGWYKQDDPSITFDFVNASVELVLLKNENSL